MRFLLSNDDGIEAPGLAALERATPGEERPLVVAPRVEQSGKSHSVTTDRPLTLEPFGERRWAVDGTPADCVRVALHEFPGEFDYVLAGINSGGNLGADVFHSGTVAAIREAALHGLPGIAVSHYRNRKLTAEDWVRAAEWVRPIVEDLLARKGGGQDLWSINLPCLTPGASMPEVVECDLDLSPHDLKFRPHDEGKLQYSGSYTQRPRKAGTDVDVCFGGRVSVTPLRLTA